MTGIGQLAGLSIALGIVAFGALLLIPFAIMVQPIIKRCLNAGGVAMWFVAIPIALYGVVAITAFLYGLVMFSDSYRTIQPTRQPYGDTTPFFEQPGP